MHAYQFWKTALTDAYTVNLQYISIKAIQWLCKETQQHTQVNMGLFARRFEMVPLWACRNVSMRTVKSQKALITSCFPFTQSEALSRVSLLLCKFPIWCCLGLVQFIWRWNTPPSLKDSNISQWFMWRVSKVNSFPDTVPIFIVGNMQAVSNCPKSIRLAPYNAQLCAWQSRTFVCLLLSLHFNLISTSGEVHFPNW